jgi:hypothetical protein
MSALPPIEDIRQCRWDVRKVPKADPADRHRVRKHPTAVEDLGQLRDAQILVLAAELRRWAQPAPNYFIVIASPLRSAFAISPTCRPESSRMAPFWLVSTIARTPPPTASPAPAAA